MNTSKIKKGLSLLMAIIMMFTMVPATIFALGADSALPVMKEFTAASSADFHKYYNQIYSVTFLDKIDEAAMDGAIESWNISASADTGTVMAWMYLNEEATAAARANRYDVYIAGEGGVAANPSSGFIFFAFGNLEKVDARHFDTKNATTFRLMFENCYNLREVNLTTWNTENVTSLENMFRNCYELETIDLSSFNTSKVTTMRFMFYLCKKLNYIYAGDGWTTESIANLYDGVFNCCYAKFGVTEAEYTEAVQNGRQFDASASKATFEDGGYLTYKAPDATETYTVTYLFTGDVIPENVTLPTAAEYEEGSTVQVEAAPTADGYVFSGWSTEDADIHDSKFTMPAKDVVIKGSWEKLYNVYYKYDERFEVPEGAPDADMLALLGSSQKAGDDVDVAGVMPSVGDYIFVGWYTDDADVAGYMFTMPENDVTLYGYFKKPVESIEIMHNEEIAINKGGTEKLNVYVKPEDATIKDITYESSNPTVATIDKYGNIEAVGEGTTTIIVKSADDPTKSDTITVTVKTFVTEINVDKTELNLNKGDTDKITGTVNADATNKEVTYESKDDTVVKVDESGNVTAVGEGTTTIIVASKDDPKIKEIVTVTVKVPVTEITVEDDFTLNLGEEKKIDAYVNEDATNKELIYEIDNTGVVKLDNYGNVFAVGEGTATITVKSADNPEIKDTVTVTVKIPVEDIVIENQKTEIAVGEELQLNVTVNPDSASVKDLEYTSSEESVAIVDQFGKVTPVGEGTTTITVKSKDNPEITDTITITVVKYVVTYEFIGETVPENMAAPVDSNRYSSGDTVKVAEDPSAFGYTFSGWTTENNADIKYGEFKIYNNVHFVGEWSEIPVEDIVADKTLIELTEGETDKITVTVTPDNATDKEVEFKSDDESVATVDKDGNVTAVGEGTATITITSKDGSVTEIVTVTVKKPFVPVEDIIVDKTLIELTQGETDKITVTVNPDNATDKEVEFKSDDESVATVDKDGNVTAVGEGTATITITSKDGEVTETVTVTVKKPVVPVEDILVVTPEFELEPGETDKIIAVVTPNNATDKSITYESSDETVVKVDEKGNITAVNEGTATITVTSNGDATKSKTVTVTVKKPFVPVEDILVVTPEFELEPGETNKIIAVVTPNNATDKSITYESSDETIVKVDEKGNITAVNEGTATITVTSNGDAAKSKTVTVTVKKPPVKITAPEKITVVLGEEKEIGASINTGETLSYSSSDESIVKVDANGKITTVAEGKATITVSGGGISAVIAVEVTAKPAYNTKHYMVFGKTEKIGWYNVSLDGGETFLLVFGNSHLEVEHGQEVIIKANDVFGDPFTFYINGKAVKPDENGYVRVIVDKYVLVGALGIPIEAPDAEESLNLFQRLIKAIKDFFAMIAGWFKK